MKPDWKAIDTVPHGERVLLTLRNGEKGNGEITVGMVFPDSEGHIDCYWTWGGLNSGSDIDEAPTHWAELPDFPDNYFPQ